MAMRSPQQSMALVGQTLLRVANEQCQAAEPLYWKPKTANHNVKKDILNWTNKKIMNQPRLLQVKGNDERMIMREVENRTDSMNSGDVFILDTGNYIYIWFGLESNKAEQREAMLVVENMCASRGMNTHYTILEEGDGDDCINFWKEIKSKNRWGRTNKNHDLKYQEVKSASQGGDDSSVKEFRGKLYSVAAKNDGSVQREKKRWRAKQEKAVDLNPEAAVNGVQTQYFARKKLDSGKAFLLDDGFTLWVWIGKSSGVSDDEGTRQAIEYLKAKSQHSWWKKTHDRPASLPIIVVKEDLEPEHFRKNFKHIRNFKRIRL